MVGAVSGIAAVSCSCADVSAAKSKQAQKTATVTSRFARGDRVNSVEDNRGIAFLVSIWADTTASAALRVLDTIFSWDMVFSWGREKARGHNSGY
jgi:hypothetical protein